ncbi:MAG: hypothetical protein OQK78_10260 [Gammaproteobacteria bacterium]|nr:hypothetical protein [Gammaproteobacteria bacterium]
MLRRLYFLLPDESHTEAVVDELIGSGYAMSSIHLLDNGEHTLVNLPKVTSSHRYDRAARLESLLWYGNLGLFFVALAAFIYSLFSGTYLLAASMSLLMLLSFTAGERFVTQLPNTHFDNFTAAIKHGEVLLMVDVPFYQVKSVSDKIHKHHPLAVLGGSCWSINALGI